MPLAPRALNHVLGLLLIHCKQKPFCDGLVKIQMCASVLIVNRYNKIKDTR